MERKISTRKYIIAFILTIIVFVGGISIGIMFENVRLSSSEQNILAEKVSLQSLQLQQKYIDSGLADCNTLNKILETNINELTKKMNAVIGYEKNAIINHEEFRLQLQDYFLTEIQFLLISQEIDKKCTKDSIKIIYFYDENEMDTQGTILDYLKKLFGPRILVFSLNSAFKEEPMINILLTSYNISQFPSVVVDDVVLHGHTSVEDLMEIACEKFVGIKDEYPKECGQLAASGKGKSKIKLLH